MNKWVPTIITILGGLATLFSPALQHFWGSHPSAATAVISGWAIIKGLLPSPLQTDAVK